jgi:hypothetical protein
MKPTPQEKAHELISEILATQYLDHQSMKQAKEVALIVTKNVLDTLYKDFYDSTNGAFEYWQEVQKEIESMPTCLC